MITTSVSSRSASLGVLFMALLAAINFAIPLSARAQDTTPRSLLDPRTSKHRQTLPELNHVPSDVRDTAGMFSADAVRKARDKLEKLERTIGVPVLIETVDTLKGETIDEVATHLRGSRALRESLC